MKPFKKFLYEELLATTLSADVRGTGNQLYLEHLGYTATIIAFYLFPLLLYRKNNLFNLFKNFLQLNKNYYLCSSSSLSSAHVFYFN